MAGPRRDDPESGRGLGLLTRTPLAKTPSNYPLRGELGTITRGDKVHERWQHKPTIKGTARIWFFVDGRTVYLEQVHTSHPNETK
ncbi:hypothetical protein MGALJ_59940 (plasmid) [Mycobacterium gallinarum]|uniref:Uncharacterized protein n=1 Tax=Mycobacterium gallinarum TaxID=39689 RepID=A0A9W4FIJ0_9MYCO|nr:hypothetical protein MGALJ_59940 [Mycobacterium gallinarum]